jgi:hypothetical protein
MDKPSLQNIIDISREMTNRLPVEKRGCGPLVALTIWTLLSENYLFPPKYIVRHMLWGLIF